MELDCEFYRDLIFKKLDNEISPQEEEILQAHLNECNACQTDYQELSQIEIMLQEQDMLEVADSFSGAVINRINGPRKKRKFMKPYFSVAAACILLVVALCSNSFQTFLSGDKGLQDDSVSTSLKSQMPNEQRTVGELTLTEGLDSQNQASDSMAEDANSAGSDNSGVANQTPKTRSKNQAQDSGTPAPQKQSSNDDATNSPDAQQSGTPQENHDAQSNEQKGGGSGGADPAALPEGETNGAAPQDTQDGLTVQANEDDQTASDTANGIAPAPNDLTGTYYCIISFSMAQTEIDEILDNFINVPIGSLTYEFSIEEFERLCQWLTQKGFNYSVDIQNENSDTVLVLIIAK